MKIKITTMSEGYLIQLQKTVNGLAYTLVKKVDCKTKITTTIESLLGIAKERGIC